MNAPSAGSLLAAVPLAPRDPILGVTEAFNADPRPRKVNLGVGVYTGEDGRVPLLECVRRAEAARVASAPPRPYLPIDGLPAFDRAVQALVFGEASAAIAQQRVVTVQTLGGTGALKIGADFLRRHAPSATVWISEPSWENHRALFEYAGFDVRAYPYYDTATRGLDFAAMCEALAALPAATIVVLHACCHNPTGVDPNAEQWRDIARIVRERKLVPFLDLAYQGFAEGVEADAAAVRFFADTLTPVFVASSFSKSFSLYAERVGALSVVAASAHEATCVLSQLKRIVRTNYSNPPAHGGDVVARVLGDAELRALWQRELDAMRERIREMRRLLVDGIRRHAPELDFSFILRQRGMFSYSGLSAEQVRTLRERYAIYAIESGRICIAALKRDNVDYVAEAIAAVAADRGTPGVAVAARRP